ncbi:serine--tRNA ligase, partial [Striga asiatica]
HTVNLLEQLEECGPHVLATQGRGLEEVEPLILGKLDGILCGNCSGVGQVSLVADQHDNDRVVRVGPQLLDPPGHVVERCSFGDVVDNHCPECAPVVRACHGPQIHPGFIAPWDKKPINKELKKANLTIYIKSQKPLNKTKTKILSTKQQEPGPPDLIASGYHTNHKSLHQTQNNSFFANLDKSWVFPTAESPITTTLKTYSTLSSSFSSSPSI